MSDYKELVSDLRDAEQVNWKRLSLDAAAAIEELQKMLKAVQKNSGINFRMWEEAQAEIERLQAQLPKRGEWKITTKKYTPELICSECGVHIPCVAGWCMDAHMNYCPNCGAQMGVQK